MNQLTTPGQYYDQVKSQPGKARGKGGRPMKALKGDFREQQATPYHMDPEVPYIKNPKPAANDLLRQLLTAPGGAGQDEPITAVWQAGGDEATPGHD